MFDDFADRVITVAQQHSTGLMVFAFVIVTLNIILGNARASERLLGLLEFLELLARGMAAVFAGLLRGVAAIAGVAFPLVVLVTIFWIRSWVDAGKAASTLALGVPSVIWLVRRLPRRVRNAQGLLLCGFVLIAFRFVAEGVYLVLQQKTWAGGLLIGMAFWEVWGLMVMLGLGRNRRLGVPLLGAITSFLLVGLAIWAATHAEMGWVVGLFLVLMIALPASGMLAPEARGGRLRSAAPDGPVPTEAR